MVQGNPVHSTSERFPILVRLGRSQGEGVQGCPPWLVFRPRQASPTRWPHPLCGAHAACPFPSGEGDLRTERLRLSGTHHFLLPAAAVPFYPLGEYRGAPPFERGSKGGVPLVNPWPKRSSFLSKAPSLEEPSIRTGLPECALDSSCDHDALSGRHWLKGLAKKG